MNNVEIDTSINARTMLTMRPALANDTSRMANRHRSVQTFLKDLRGLWRHSGQPNAWTMATRLRVPAARFEFLFRPVVDLPDIEDVLALLMAIGARPDVMSRWQRRWERLNSGDSVPVDTVTLQPMDPAQAEEKPQGSGVSVKIDGPLGKALRAETPEEFVEQLRALRNQKGISYEAIDKATGGRVPRSTAHYMLKPGNFPRREDQVECFVRACGIDQDEARIWLTAYTRAQRRTRIPRTGVKSSGTGHKDASRALESIGDELARAGRCTEAIEFYKEALAQLRC